MPSRARRWAPTVRRWIDSPVAVTAAAMAVRPQPPSSSCRRKTAAAGWRSALAGESLEGTAAVGVEVGHLAGKVTERDVAELVDQGGDLRLGTPVDVLLARQRRAVDVGLALTAADKQAFAVEPSHHRHEGGVRPRLLGLGVDVLHHFPDRGLPAGPDGLHDLFLGFVEWWWEAVADHLLSTIVDRGASGKARNPASTTIVVISRTIDSTIVPPWPDSVKPNRLARSLISSPASDPAAMPMPPSASASSVVRPARRLSRSTGAASAAATSVAETKLSTKSVPIVGTAS